MTGKILVAAAVSAMLAGGVRGEEINPVVGKTGDMTLKESDLKRIIGYQPPELQQRLQADPEQRVNLVRQLLTAEVIAKKARAEGFDKRPDVMEQLGYLIDRFLAQEYLAQKVTAAVTVPEEDLKRYYREHQQEYVIPEKIRARHIFIEVASDAGEEQKSAARSRAVGVLQRLKNGEEFARVARESSDDADTAGKGGELGTIAPGKTNSREFEAAAFALTSGETSGVVATPFGYHIIRVDERQEQRVASFDEVREYIAAVLKRDAEQKRAQEFIERVTRDAGLAVLAEKITGVRKEPAATERK